MKPSASVGAPRSADEPVLFDLVEEMAARLQAGDSAAVEAWIAAQGEHAERLRRLLPTVRVMAELGSAADGQEATGPEDTPVSGLLGDFRILREVGRGGMGIVYEAEQISLGRRVALKVLPYAATMDPRHLQRFKNEARAAASLHHEHIVPVHGVGCERGVHFYAMQFIDGTTLAEVIRVRRDAGEGPAGPPDARLNSDATTALAVAPPTPGSRPLGKAHFRRTAELIAQAADALEYAHSVGVVHRDVKPGNLMVDAAGKLWVTDFGLAKLDAAAGLTVSGDLVGTLRYMSPEQALAKHDLVDHRTDIYSLGATLYELLTPQPAVDGADKEEVLRRIAFEEPVAPRKRVRKIPVELETVVLKALAKDPADRYATAQALADDLERFLKDEPVRARRPSLWQRGRKWARRHRAGVAAVAALLLLGATFTGTAWVAAARRQAEVEGAVERALDEAAVLAGQQDWHEAVSAARRAEGLLAGSSVRAALRQRVSDTRADLEMVQRLETISLDMAAVKDGHYDTAARAEAYRQAFAAYGVDRQAQSPAEAAAGIRASPIREHLLAALYDWTFRVQAGPSTSEKRWCADVLRAADADPWRTQLREALGSKDGRALERLATQLLERLAAGSEADSPPPITLILVGDALGKRGAVKQAVSVLRAGQQLHPAVFWLNHELARWLDRDKPPQREEAIRFYTAASVLRPRSPGVWNNLGTELRNQGKREEAAAALRRAIELKPEYAEAHCNLGLVLRDQGRREEAAAAFRKALELKPDSAEAHHGLGLVLGEQGKREEAVALFRKALALKPNSAEAHNDFGVVLVAQGKREEAAAAYHKALALKPDFAEAHANLGGVLHAQGRPQEAAASFRRALELKPDYAKAHFGLGLVLAAQGQRAGAVASYRRALEIQPDFVEALGNLGDALLTLGQPEEAAALLRRTIALKPDCAEAHFGLGVVLAAQGKREEAAASYRRALEIQPDSIKALGNLGILLSA
jgi:tetratricopeptide (TPR) repeat protein